MNFCVGSWWKKSELELENEELKQRNMELEKEITRLKNHEGPYVRFAENLYNEKRRDK